MLTLTDSDFYLHPSDTYPYLRIEILGKNTDKKYVKQQILENQEKAEKFKLIEKLIRTHNGSDYYDDGNIDQKKFDELYQKILKNDKVVDRLRKFIGHLSQMYLDDKLENANSIIMLLVVRDCVLNGKFGDSMKSWEPILSETSDSQSSREVGIDE